MLPYVEGSSALATLNPTMMNGRREDMRDIFSLIYHHCMLGDIRGVFELPCFSNWAAHLAGRPVSPPFQAGEDAGFSVLLRCMLQLSSIAKLFRVTCPQILPAGLLSRQ